MKLIIWNFTKMPNLLLMNSYHHPENFNHFDANTPELWTFDKFWYFPSCGPPCGSLNNLLKRNLFIFAWIVEEVSTKLEIWITILNIVSSSRKLRLWMKTKIKLWFFNFFQCTGPEKADHLTFNRKHFQNFLLIVDKLPSLLFIIN